MEESVPVNATARKIDTVMNKAVRYFSYLGGVAIIISAILLFVNVVSSKVFHKAWANVNDIVDYLLVVVVYCCVADCQLNGGGMIQVDIFFRKFPYLMKKIVKGIGYIMGTVMYCYVAYRAIGLLKKYYTFQETASTSSGSFVIWPFCLIFIIGCFLLSVALLWSVIRMGFLPRPETELGPGDYDLKEMNVKGKLFAEHPEEEEGETK